MYVFVSMLRCNSKKKLFKTGNLLKLLSAVLYITLSLMNLQFNKENLVTILSN